MTIIQLSVCNFNSSLELTCQIFDGKLFVFNPSKTFF